MNICLQNKIDEIRCMRKLVILLMVRTDWLVLKKEYKDWLSFNQTRKNEATFLVFEEPIDFLLLKNVAYTDSFQNRVNSC